MNGWLVTWDKAGHDRIDRVVTILPEDYSLDDVTIVLRALFFVGSFTIGETLHHLTRRENTPYVLPTRFDNDYTSLRIEMGSDVLHAHPARNITVTEDGERHETIRWQ